MITLLSLLGIVAASLFIWVYLLWLKTRRYWADKQVPHHPPHPIFGSLSFLLKDNAVIWLRDLDRQFKSPYFGIWLFWRPALVINCPNLVRKVFSSDAHIFRNRFISAGTRDKYGSSNLFTMNDPEWSVFRRHLSPVFTSAKLRALQDLVSAKAKNLIQRIIMEKKENTYVQLRDIFTDYTTDVLSIAAFGVTGNATLDRNSPMRAVTRDFMSFNLHRALSWASIFFFPGLTNIFHLPFFPPKTTKYLKNIFSTAVAERGGYNNEQIKDEDLLNALIKMKRDMGKEGKEISEELLVAQAAVFIQGGFDSTAVNITYATYELAFAPHVQERLYKELLEAQSAELGLDARTLQELPYLNCVIKETLRKYPAMGWLDRVASSDYKIVDDLIIPAGTPVYVNAAGMHYNSEYFTNPQEFIPERFLPENETNIEPFTFVPFGDGPRHCIGQRFAQLMIRYAVAAILLNFELRPAPNSPKPRDCPTETRGVLLAPRYPLYVDFIPREPRVNSQTNVIFL